MAATCDVDGTGKNIYKVSAGNPKGKRSFGRPRYRSDNNIQMNLKETGWMDVDLIYIAQD